MAKPVIRHKPADADLREIEDWFCGESVLLALRFLNAVDATLDLLSEHPGMGSMRHAEYFDAGMPTMRFFPIKGFEKYLVYYFETATTVQVLRVIHSARDLQALME